MRIAGVAALLVLLAGCASSSQSGPGAGAGSAGAVAAEAGSGGKASVVGNERGGKILDGVANSANAMTSVRTHCANFGEKGFITKWDSPTERGVIVFECH